MVTFEGAPGMIWAAATLAVLLIAVLVYRRHAAHDTAPVASPGILGMHGTADVRGAETFVRLANGERHPARPADGTRAPTPGERVVLTGFAGRTALVVAAPHPSPDDPTTEGPHAEPTR